MKKIGLLVFFIFVFFISFSNVSAKDVTVTTEYIDGVYSNRQKGGMTYWGKFAYIKIDGKIGYCLDPVNIIGTTDYYTSEDFSTLNISDEQLKLLENYAYYGYGYEGHTSKEYYMATQQLIWETIPDFVIYYTTGANKQGDRIDVSSYMQEIKETIASKNKLPNLPSSISGKVGQSMMINDENNVLSDYQLESESPNVSLDGNQLIVNFNEPMTENITLVRKPRDSFISYLCLAEHNQTVSLLGVNNQDKLMFTVETKPLKKAILRVYKKDSLSNNIITSKVKFKIKDLSSNKFFTYKDNMIFETNEDGILKLPFYLEEGNYSIIEVEAPFGYYKEDEELKFSITDDTSLTDEKYLDVDFSNTPMLSKLKIIKIDKDTNETLYGAKFEIYNESNELIGTISTDKQGIAELSDVRYGKYYIKEIQAPDGYIIDTEIKEVIVDDFDVNIKIYNQKVEAPDTNVSKNSLFGFLGLIIITLGILIIKKIKYYSK